MSNAATVSRLDAIIKEHNPCGISRAEDGTFKCRGGTPCCYHWGAPCRHLTTSGCAVNAVVCKFFFCKYSWAILPKPVRAEIRRLLALYKGPLKLRFDDYRMRKRTIARIYFGIAARPGLSSIQQP